MFTLPHLHSGLNKCCRFLKSEEQYLKFAILTIYRISLIVSLDHLCILLNRYYTISKREKKQTPNIVNWVERLVWADCPGETGKKTWKESHTNFCLNVISKIILVEGEENIYSLFFYFFVYFTCLEGLDWICSSLVDFRTRTGIVREPVWCF